MEINIFTPDKDASEIEGFTIVVDVFRAFSTAYYIYDNNPQKYILSESIEHSFELKRERENVLLIGERQGVQIEGFDFGNSPADIAGKNFSKNIIVHTTTSGTKGVLAQPPENEVVVGSFVNIQAIINHVHSSGIEKVNIYCTAMPDKKYGEEDIVFAEYLKARLLNSPCSFEETVTYLRNGTGRVFVDEIFAPYSDFLMCMDINRFDFILERKITGNSVELSAML